MKTARAGTLSWFLERDSRLDIAACAVHAALSYRNIASHTKVFCTFLWAHFGTAFAVFVQILMDSWNLT